jgi:hypothetical protein
MTIHLTKGLGQIDLPDGLTDDGKLSNHILWIYEVLFVNPTADIYKAATDAAGIEPSWVNLAINHLVGIGAIVVEGGQENV